MSEKVGKDWNTLGGLLGIPYHQREEIRFNSSNYRSFPLKAKQIFLLYNESMFFSRCVVKKCLKELNRYDLEKEIIPVGPVENQVFHI